MTAENKDSLSSQLTTVRSLTPKKKPSTEIAKLKDVDDDDDDDSSEDRKTQLVKKKYRRYMLPLLLAYKLKFFTLIPLMMGGLFLLIGSTGLAGFFFALFAAVISLKSTKSSHDD